MAETMPYRDNATIVLHGNWSHWPGDKPPRFRCPVCNRLIADFSEIVIVDQADGYHEDCFRGSMLAGLLTGQVTDALAAVGRMQAKAEEPAHTFTLDGPGLPPRPPQSLQGRRAAKAWRDAVIAIRHAERNGGCAERRACQRRLDAAGAWLDAAKRAEVTELMLIAADAEGGYEWPG